MNKLEEYKMTTIKERLLAHCVAINTLQQEIQKQAEAQIALKKVIQSNDLSFYAEELAGLTRDQQIAKFEQAIEEQVENNTNTSQSSSLKSILDAQRIAGKVNNPDDLATEPDTKIKLEIEEEAIIPDHEEMERIRQEELAKTGKQESFSLSIQLNEKQLFAKRMVEQKKSICLVGPAGSGKTTATRTIAASLLKDDALSISSFKLANSGGARVSAPSIAFCAYTRRAAANLAKAIWKDPELEEKLKFNVMTVHALLEYEPEEYWDPTEEKTKFRFAPRKTAANPLDITHLIIEEASMIDAIVLWDKLYAALPIGVQIIFIGDINQLPPPFGPSILNYALMQLPIVELTETYRNQGIVLDNAHRILRGEKLEEDHNYKIVRGNKPIQQSQFVTANQLKALFQASYNTIGDDGLPEYDPEDCMILSPFNKQELGTDNMNKHIAQFIGDKRGAIVHEIIAGFNKIYLAEGDRVMYNKRDAIITSISLNPNYHGRDPQPPGADLSRHGFRVLGKNSAAFDDDSFSANYDNFSLESLENEAAERKQQASHKVVIKYDHGYEETLSSAGDFGTAVFSLGYCLTVHKAQGSEWRKVFIILHKDHAVMLFRELFYTAATRARTKVTIIAKDFVIDKAIKNQRIKGNSLKDKLEFFNSGVDTLSNIVCVKL